MSSSAENGLLAARAPGVGRGLTFPDVAVLLGFFFAPMSAIGVGYGVRVADVAFCLSVVGLLLTRAGNLVLPADVSARRAFGGLSLITIGMVLGEINGGSEQAAALRVGLTGLAAMLPLLLVGYLVHRRYLIERAAYAFVLGTSVSVLVGLTNAGIAVGGRSLGLASHMNQLAMTAVMALSLLVIAPAQNSVSRLFRLCLLALLAYGLFRSGSRSGVLACGIVAVSFAAWYIRRAAMRVFLVAIVLLATLIFLRGFIPEIAANEAGAVGRIRNSSAVRSDEARLDLLGQAGESLSWERLFIGDVSMLERSPHNVWLEALLFGGLISFLGFLIVFIPLAWPAATSFRGPLRVVQASSAAILGYLVAVSFNNALFPRFAWCGVALTVAAIGRERRVAIAARLGKEQPPGLRHVSATGGGR